MFFASVFTGVSRMPVSKKGAYPQDTVSFFRIDFTKKRGSHLVKRCLSAAHSVRHAASQSISQSVNQTSLTNPVMDPNVHNGTNDFVTKSMLRAYRPQMGTTKSAISLPNGIWRRVGPEWTQRNRRRRNRFLFEACKLEMGTTISAIS